MLLPLTAESVKLGTIWRGHPHETIHCINLLFHSVTESDSLLSLLIPVVSFIISTLHLQLIVTVYPQKNENDIHSSIIKEYLTYMTDMELACQECNMLLTAPTRHIDKTVGSIANRQR